MSDSRTQVDEAIGRAVRDLMLREPPAGFRSRVLSRLEAAPRRPALWPALATAAGLLAVAAIGIVVLREPAANVPAMDTPVAVSQPVPSRPAAEAAPASPEVSAPAIEPRARRVRPVEPIRTATFGAREGRVSAANLAPTRTGAADAAPPPESAVEAESSLPSQARIEVRPLASPNPIEIAPILVPPLQIPRMPQAPASPPR